MCESPIKISQRGTDFATLKIDQFGERQFKRGQKAFQETYASYGGQE